MTPPPSDASVPGRSGPESGPEGGPRASPALRAAVCLALAAAVALAFRPALDAGLLNWDDDANLVDNPHFRGLGEDQLRWMFTTPHGGPYMPLTWMSLALDHALFGLGEGFEPPEAGAWHGVNVALHALVAVLFCGLARRLLSAAGADPGARSTALAAGLAAAFFAVHPLRVESVAWLTERRDVLSGVFLVLAASAYLRARDAPARLAPRAAALAVVASGAAVALFFGAVELGPERLALGPLGLPGLVASVLALAVGAAAAPRATGAAGTTGATRRSLMASVAWLVPAFLSKALGVTLPLVLLVVDLWPLRRWRRTDGPRGLLALVAEKAPYLALSLVFGVLAVWGQARYPEALVRLDEHPLPQRLAQAVYGLWFYPTRTLVPLGLVPLVELPPSAWIGEARFLVPALGVVALAVLAVALRRRAPALGVALVSFALLIAPVLGLTQAGAQLVADRYSYVACMPFAPLAAGAALALVRRRPRAAAPVTGLALALVATFGVLTHRQTAVWRDTETLWNHNLAVVPEAVRPHYMLARMHYRAGQEGGGREALERARAEFAAGLARDPRVHPYYHGIYGALLIDMGRFDEAVRVLGAVVEVRPGDALALTNLGVALRSLGRLPEARAVGERAVRADPSYTKGWLQLAQTREAVGDRAAAAEAWHAVLASWPRYGPARRRLKELEGAGGGR